MHLRILAAALFALPLLAGCKTARPDKPSGPGEEAARTTEEAPLPQGETFEAFVGRLRAAVAAKDIHAVASMMTSNFGYRLKPLGEGEGVFQFWEEGGLWGELDLVLAEEFVSFGGFMVAPAVFAEEPDRYSGYRAGIAETRSGWRFAYFVSD